MPFFNRKTESDGSKPGTKQVRGRASDAVGVTSNASGAEPSPSEMGWITPKPNEENTKASGSGTASEAVPTYGGAAAEQLGLHGERAYEFHSSSVADVDTLDIDVPVDDNAKTVINNDNDDAIPYSYDDPSVDASVSGIVFTSEEMKKALDDNGDGVITADELYDDDDSIEPLENDMSPLFDKMFGNVTIDESTDDADADITNVTSVDETLNASTSDATGNFSYDEQTQSEDAFAKIDDFAAFDDTDVDTSLDEFVDNFSDAVYEDDADGRAPTADIDVPYGIDAPNHDANTLDAVSDDAAGNDDGKLGSGMCVLDSLPDLPIDDDTVDGVADLSETYEASSSDAAETPQDAAERVETSDADNQNEYDDEAVTNAFTPSDQDADDAFADLDDVDDIAADTGNGRVNPMPSDIAIPSFDDDDATGSPDASYPSFDDIVDDIPVDGASPHTVADRLVPDEYVMAMERKQKGHADRKSIRSNVADAELRADADDMAAPTDDGVVADGWQQRDIASDERLVETRSDGTHDDAVTGDTEHDLASDTNVSPVIAEYATTDSGMASEFADDAPSEPADLSDVDARDGGDGTADLFDDAETVSEDAQKQKRGIGRRIYDFLVNQTRDENLLCKGDTRMPNGRIHFRQGNHVPLMLVFAMILIAILAQVVVEAYDNDLWFILSTGREIVQNGIPQLNPFAMHAGMDIVVQQWVPDVLSYLSYTYLGGMVGIGLLLSVAIGIMCFVMYRLGRLFSGRKVGGETILALMIPSVIALSSYLSARPQVWTMIFFMIVMYLCEAYRRTRRYRYAALLPLAVFAHVNFHMSMAPFDLFIIACYAIPNIPDLWRQRRLTRLVRKGRRNDASIYAQRVKKGCVGLYRGDYQRLPLLGALLVSCVAMLLNPYGLDGATYLLSSYGAAAYADYISEMGALTVWNAEWGIAMVVMLVIGAMAVGKHTSRRIDLPLTILFAVTGVLAFQHVRNVWLVVPFAFALACDAYGGMHMPRGFMLFDDTRLQRKLFGFATAIVAVAMGVTCVYNLSTDLVGGDSTSTPAKAMDYLDRVGADRDDTKIFNFFNAGGYIEWRDYKVFIDPRPELWEPGITGISKHYYQEFVDAATGATSIMNLVDEYDFDYLIANTNTTLNGNLANDDDYRVVVSGNGYNLYEKIRNDNESVVIEGDKSDDAGKEDGKNENAKQDKDEMIGIGGKIVSDNGVIDLGDDVDGKVGGGVDNGNENVDK